MPKRNGAIDLLKFIASLGVVGVHFHGKYAVRFFHCGYMSVEFFFVVSGYLLALKASKYNGTNIISDNLNFIKKRILGIFPYLFPASLAGIFFMYCYTNIDMAIFGQSLLLTLGEWLGLQMLGWTVYSATQVSWYLSALFFISFLLYPVLCKKRALFTKYIAPGAALFILGIINLNEGKLGGVDAVYMGGVYLGLLRGVVGIFLGTVAFELSSYINGRDNKHIGLFEILGSLIFIWYIFFAKHRTTFDFYIVLLIVLIVAISFSNKSILANVFSHPVFNLLGKFSLSIYLNHLFVIEACRVFLKDAHKHIVFVIYIGIVFVLSLGNYFMGNWLAIGTERAKKYVVPCILFVSAIVAWKFGLQRYFPIGS